MAECRRSQQIRDLEVVPRVQVPHRDATFPEMDVDAVLARRPAMALVDELAHTNTPGMRNAKRWQDVEELLAAGIDVISTVNIQHLESLNDVVLRITGVDPTRDGPRRVRAIGRPDRAGRHVARGTASANGARQRVPGGEGRRRARQLLPAGQPGGAARAGAAVGRRPCRGQPSGLPHRPRHHHHVGDARAGGRRAHRRAGRATAHSSRSPHRWPAARRPGRRARRQPRWAVVHQRRRAGEPTLATRRARRHLSRSSRTRGRRIARRIRAGRAGHAGGHWRHATVAAQRVRPWVGGQPIATLARHGRRAHHRHRVGVRRDRRHARHAPAAAAQSRVDASRWPGCCASSACRC